MTFEDDPPNTPAPVPSIALPSVPPAPKVPGDFARTEQQRAPDTLPTPLGRTLSDEDLLLFRGLIVEAVNQVLDQRLGAVADMQRVAADVHEKRFAHLQGEDRDNLARIAGVESTVGRIEASLSEVRGLIDPILQQTTKLRHSMAPHVEEIGEAAQGLSKAATGYLQELRAETELPTPHEEEAPDTRRR